MGDFGKADGFCGEGLSLSTLPPLVAWVGRRHHGREVRQNCVWEQGPFPANAALRGLFYTSAGFCGFVKSDLGNWGFCKCLLDSV